MFSFQGAFRRNQIHNLRIYLFKLNARPWLCFSSPIKTRFAGLLIGSESSFKKLNEVMISHRFSQSLE